jgi:hypothetical protein
VPSFRLRLTRPDTITAEEAQSSFYWLTDDASSFTTKLDPRLSVLGPVPELNIDLVRIAVAAYAADRSASRSGGGSDWNQRDLDIKVPVSNPGAWNAVTEEFSSVLAFLTGDRWTLTFNAERPPTTSSTPDGDSTEPPKRVVLLSGGADSAIGALLSRTDLGKTERHTLVSHVSFTPLSPIQRSFASTIERLVPGPGQQHVQVQLSRNKHRIDGKDYPSESSSRSRSLLFLALGLAVASIHKVPLWIPENGFASLNPPLGPDRRGSLSTRTTHPQFLGGLAAVLQTVGAHGAIENPFADLTKGEMFRRAVELVGDHEAGAFLSATNSCAHTGQRSFRVSPTTSCGVCFGCVVRRAAFHAAGIADTTPYIATGTDAKLDDWLEANSVIPAVRSFVRRGVRAPDIIALSLPPTYPIATALELCRRAISELQGLVQ